MTAPAESPAMSTGAWIRRVLLQLVIALVVLAVLEFLLGLVVAPQKTLLYSPDPVLFWRLKPGIQNHTQVSPEPTGEVTTTHITTNKLGLRDDEIPDRAAPNELRVLVLGDSSIFGHGVKLEQTFVKQLEKRLAAAMPGRKVRVINGGVSGYSSFQGRIWFHELGARLKPQIVVVGYYFSDQVPDLMPDKARVMPGFFRSSLARMLSRSAIYQFLRDEIEARASRRADATAGSSLVERVSPEDYRANLAAIMDEADGLGARCMMLLLAPREQPVPVAQVPYRTAARDLCATRKVPVVDMEAAFNTHPKRFTLFLDEVHPSAAGDEIVADELFKSLGTSGLVKDRGAK